MAQEWVTAVWKGRHKNAAFSSRGREAAWVRHHSQTFSVSAILFSVSMLGRDANWSGLWTTNICLQQDDWLLVASITPSREGKEDLMEFWPLGPRMDYVMTRPPRGFTKISLCLSISLLSSIHLPSLWISLSWAVVPMKTFPKSWFPQQQSHFALAACCVTQVVPWSCMGPVPSLDYS